MKHFIRKFLVISLFCFLVIELISRLFIDPFYFYATNTFNENQCGNDPKCIYSSQSTNSVDYLFIGSSRVPACINSSLLKTISNGKVVVNGGRGYMTPGISYQALKNKLEESPEYLKDAMVFLEYPGYDNYTNAFKDDQMRVHESSFGDKTSMPHLILPHLTFKSFLQYWKESNNSIPVKLELSMLYCLSSYRTIPYVNEKFSRLNSELFRTRDAHLVQEGGIKTEGFDFAIQAAIDLANENKAKLEEAPLITKEELNNSSLCKIHELIAAHGGKLIMYQMPLHSVQEDVYSSPQAQKNTQIFEAWLSDCNIRIIYLDKLKFQDKDFPDTWHLARDRRDEFTTSFYHEIEKMSKTKISAHGI